MSSILTESQKYSTVPINSKQDVYDNYFRQSRTHTVFYANSRRYISADQMISDLLEAYSGAYRKYMDYFYGKNDGNITIKNTDYKINLHDMGHCFGLTTLTERKAEMRELLKIYINTTNMNIAKTTASKESYDRLYDFSNKVTNIYNRISTLNVDSNDNEYRIAVDFAIKNLEKEIYSFLDYFQKPQNNAWLNDQVLRNNVTLAIENTSKAYRKLLKYQEQFIITKTSNDEIVINENNKTLFIEKIREIILNNYFNSEDKIKKFAKLILSGFDCDDLNIYYEDVPSFADKIWDAVKPYKQNLSSMISDAELRELINSNSKEIIRSIVLGISSDERKVFEELNNIKQGKNSNHKHYEEVLNRNTYKSFALNFESIDDAWSYFEENGLNSENYIDFFSKLSELFLNIGPEDEYSAEVASLLINEISSKYNDLYIKYSKLNTRNRINDRFFQISEKIKEKDLFEYINKHIRNTSSEKQMDDLIDKFGFVYLFNKCIHCPAVINDMKSKYDHDQVSFNFIKIITKCKMFSELDDLFFERPYLYQMTGLQLSGFNVNNDRVNYKQDKVSFDKDRFIIKIPSEFDKCNLLYLENFSGVLKPVHVITDVSEHKNGLEVIAKTGSRNVIRKIPNYDGRVVAYLRNDLDIPDAKFKQFGEGNYLASMSTLNERDVNNVKYYSRSEGNGRNIEYKLLLSSELMESNIDMGTKKHIAEIYDNYNLEEGEYIR